MKTWVSNPEVFELSPLRKDALKILDRGLTAVDSASVIHNELKWDKQNRILNIGSLTYQLGDFENFYFIAIGKCAVESATAVEDMLGEEITDGFVLDVGESSFSKLQCRRGTHPHSSEQNVSATKEIAGLISQASEKDLILVIISGGGSALLAQPYKIGLDELSVIFKGLTAKGATIEELNTVRKHLSEVTGGQLAEMAYPATVINLLMSDVAGDDPSIIASGPFVKDDSTVTDAQNILEKYGLTVAELRETPKDSKYFEKVSTEVIVNSHKALEAMRQEAQTLGYSAEIETDVMKGEASEVGVELGKRHLSPKSAVFLAGETTVNIRNPDGEGGRNMEVALGALLTLQDSADEQKLILACASDGRDNSDFAGAIADEVSLMSSKYINLNPKEFLEKNNSKKFWEQVDGRIITGPTGINVADFVFVLSR
jgi:glycerate 2-kinase